MVQLLSGNSSWVKVTLNLRNHFFIVYCFRVDDNFDQYDAGLVTFIKSGEGEEWRLININPEEKESWTPEEEWQVVNITLENMYEFMPRMGYLFTDGLFDLEKVASGEQKFVMRNSVNNNNNIVESVERKYQEYRFLEKQEEVETGFVDVELSEQMMEDLDINASFKDDIAKGIKRIVGKLL